MAPCEDDIATASTGWDRQVSPEVEEGYTVIRDLGSGKFAWVKEVQQKGSKKRFAWKHVVMEKNPLCEVEVELLRRMKHENIVGIHDVYSAFGVMDIMLELCKGGSMREYMLSKSEEVFRGCTVYEPPEPSEVRNTMHQLLTALNFLHGNLVAHRDIKPDNVLLSSRGRWKTWKLADFNLACEFDPKSPMTETVGSRPFTAPEVYEGHYTEKCDLYSMGVLFIAFVTGLMYTGKDCENDPKNKKDVEKLWDEKRWNRRAGSGSMDLAKKMIAPEKDRCHAEEALRTMLAQLRSSGASEGACCVIA